jgi:hypothetical protein
MLLIDEAGSIEKLKQFIEQWAGPRLPEYGVILEEIPEALPQPLKELYLFAGNWPHPRGKGAGSQRGKQPWLFQEQDGLLGVADLKQKDGRITFLIENQGNWSCWVEANNAQSPVHSDSMALYDDEEKSDDEIVCESLPHFLTTFCLQELVFSSKIVGTLDDLAEEELYKKPLEPVWLNGCYVYQEPTHSFYICDNRLLIMKVYGGIWCGCRNEQDLDLLRNKEYFGQIF